MTVFFLIRIWKAIFLLFIIYTSFLMCQKLCYHVWIVYWNNYLRLTSCCRLGDLNLVPDVSVSTVESIFSDSVSAVLKKVVERQKTEETPPLGLALTVETDTSLPQGFFRIGHGWKLYLAIQKAMKALTCIVFDFNKYSIQQYKTGIF